MALSLFALGFLVGAAGAAVDTSAPTPVGAITAERFEGRPQARIAFAGQIQNFEVKRENSDDILYLETTRDRWYRGEIICFGISDPRDAHGILPIERGVGVDGYTRFLFVGFGHERNECTLRGLIELTRDEATGLGLSRPRRVSNMPIMEPETQPPPAS
jgi:hypothetical protein